MRPSTYDGLSRHRAAAAFAIAAIALTAAACRRSSEPPPAPPPPPPLRGVWEGEIANPGRPYVVNVDFTSASAQLAAGGSITVKLDGLVVSGDRVSFALQIGADTWRFNGARRDRAIEGDVATPGERIPFWLVAIPDAGPPADRAAAWRQDLDVVLGRFLRYDHSYDDDARAAARAGIERLQAAAADRSDAQIMVELARAVALGGNAHTRLYLMRNRTELRRLPVRVWWFRDELRIVRAGDAHRELLGCQVIAFDGTASAAAADRVRGIKAGNPSWQRYMSSYLLTSPELLAAIGVARAPDRVTLELRCDRGRRVAALAALPLQRSSKPVEAWWDLAPSYPHPEPGFASALPGERVPRYLRNPDKAYWFERAARDDTIYLQLNRAQAMASDPMPELIARVVRELDGRRPRAIVVDLRFNTGGDLTVATPLVDRLAAALRGVPAVVLTSRATFSAGITHAAQWKQLAGARVVGEPVGDELDMWSEGGNLVLPSSGLTIHYANGFHAYSKRAYPGRKPVFDLDIDSLQPDVVVEPSWADYIAGADPVYDAALALLAR